MKTILIPVSIGELFDKITILQIKSERINDPEKLKNVGRELTDLLHVAHKLSDMDVGDLVRDLKLINSELWDIEDFKRSCERELAFDEKFVEAARLVYLKNDERARIKKEINALTGSAIVEEKSYK